MRCPHSPALPKGQSSWESLPPVLPSAEYQQFAFRPTAIFIAEAASCGPFVIHGDGSMHTIVQAFLTCYMLSIILKCCTSHNMMLSSPDRMRHLWTKNCSCGTTASHRRKVSKQHMGRRETWRTAAAPAMSRPSTVRIAVSPGSQRRAMSRPALTRPPGLLRRSRIKESQPRSCFH